MLEVLIGNIASGKSTYSKQRAKDGWIILNDDGVVNLVHGGCYYTYSKSLKPLYKSIEDHILYTAVAMGKNVCIDRGVDIRKKSRERWICIGRSLDVPVRASVFEAFPPEVHAQRRMESDSRGHDYQYWFSVANSFAAQYEEPTIEEGFVEVELKKWE